MTDINILDHGSICLIDPLTDDGHKWVQEHILDGNEEVLFFGNMIVCESRYIPDIVQGMLQDGLVVEYNDIKKSDRK